MNTDIKRYPVGRELRVRMGTEWKNARVLSNDGTSITTTVTGHAGPVYIHRSVLRRDTRLT